MKPIASLLSIITRTCGDRRAHLQFAATSIFEQVYRPIEWLIIEDGNGSTNTTVAEFTPPHGVEIKFQSLPKSGRSAAANAGLDLASGEFIGFLDDDDHLLPRHGQVLIDLLKRSQSAAAYAAAFQTFRVKGKSGLSGVRDERVHFLPVANSAPLIDTNFFSIQAVIFRSNIIFHNRFDVNLNYLEDWLFWLRLLLEKKLVWTPEITSRFFVPADNRDFSDRASHHAAAQTYFDIQRRAFLQRGLWSATELLTSHNTKLSALAKEAFSRSAVRS